MLPIQVQKLGGSLDGQNTPKCHALVTTWISIITCQTLIWHSIGRIIFTPGAMFGCSPLAAVFSHSPGECTISSRGLACTTWTHFKAGTLTWRGFKKKKNVTLHIYKQEFLPLRENKEDPTAFPTYQRQRLVCSQWLNQIVLYLKIRVWDVVFCLALLKGLTLNKSHIWVFLIPSSPDLRLPGLITALSVTWKILIVCFGGNPSSR